MTFTISCIPPKGTHQSALRVFGGRPVRQRTSKAEKERQTLQALLMPHRPKEPLQGPLRLRVSWIYPYRKAEPKKNRGHLLPCDTRPDCDNLAKGLCDIMTGLGFWHDDAQVARLHFSKWWGPEPGISIEIETL